MNNFRKSPCYKCTERKPACCDTCDKYKEWVKYRKEVKEYLKPKKSYILETHYQKKGSEFRTKHFQVGD